jgi:hypothetical protein
VSPRFRSDCRTIAATVRVGHCHPIRNEWGWQDSRAQFEFSSPFLIFSRTYKGENFAGFREGGPKSIGISQRPRGGATVRGRQARRGPESRFVAAARRTEVLGFLAMAGFSTLRGLIFNDSMHSIFQKEKYRLLYKHGALSPPAHRHVRGSPRLSGSSAERRLRSLEIGPLRNGGSPWRKINHADMLYTLTPNI